MEMIMKRISSLLIVLACLSQIYGSETRTFSMGQMGLFVRDNSNVIPFPGTLLMYNNEIMTELRIKDAENQFSGGVHLPFMKSGAMVGVYLNRPLLPMDPLGVGNNVAILSSTDLLYGMRVGNNNLGFRLSYAADAFEQDFPEVDKTARYIELAGGLSSRTLDLGVNVFMPSIDNKTVTGDDEWSAIGVGANGRYFYEVSENMEYVPVVIVGFTSGSRDFNPAAGASQKTDFSAYNVTLAGAMNYKVDENNLIILGIQAYSVAGTSTDQQNIGETIQTTTIFPAVHLGAETQIASWLTGRIGAYQAFQTSTIEFKPDGGLSSKSSSSASFLNFTFGLGIEVGQFLIDLDLNDGTLFEGPNILSGRTRDVFNRVSVTYQFGKQKGESE
jgi:hypothetical protein